MSILEDIVIDMSPGSNTHNLFVELRYKAANLLSVIMSVFPHNSHVRYFPRNVEYELKMYEGSVNISLVIK